MLHPSSRPRRLAPLPPLLALLFAAAAVGCGGQGSASGSDGSGAVGEDEGAARLEAVPAPLADVDSARLPAAGTAWVVLRGDTVVAEMARTGEQRAAGLMNRSRVPDGTGMLFVFEDAAVRSFWMKDTYVPLDIAFIGPDLRIVDIQRMEPEVTETYDSAAPAMFALEVRQGWLAEHGWRVGDVVEITFGG